jgi:hypothetical protein
MSRAGRRAADDLGRTLPRYGSQEEAERALFAQRDLLLGRLRTAAAASPSFQCDFTPESLKTLERWYFEVRERGTLAKYGLSSETFERCIAMYFGEVIIKNHAAFRWVVREFPFLPGAYEIGVDRGTLAVMLTRWGEVYARPNNRKRESIWREYQRWVS